MSDNENEIFEVTDAPVEEEVKQSEEAVNANETAASEETQPVEEEAVSSETEASESKTSANKKKFEKGSVAYEILDWLRTICIGVLAGIFIVVFLIQRDNVYGDSMKPTLSSGDIIYAQKISTYFDTYKRGDIVILDGHDMEGYYSKEYLVKRIVGLPGETVKIEDGNVYIKPADSNEFYLLQENYLPEGTRTTMMDDARKRGNEIVLGEDEYYCLGDNRPVSNDSRNLGPFTSDRIKGVAVIRVFPLNEVKIL